MEKVDKKNQNNEKEKQLNIIKFYEKKRKRKDLKDQSFKFMNGFLMKKEKMAHGKWRKNFFFQESGSNFLQEQAYDYIDVAINLLT
ncbi:MAG: hypothetical protein CM15mP56_2810 [Alphaproteobacteria bacterium]|nr:MAG: hypothetical protein CM15mP56_2810 [Alphaproteobacteria bacterium]